MCGGSRVARVLACAAGIISFVQGISAQTPPSRAPVEAFASLPSISSPSLSPDGKHLAMVQTRDGRPVATIWTLDVSGGQPVIIPYTEGFIEAVRWANNQRLLIKAASKGGWGYKGQAWRRTVSIDVEGKSSVVMFSNMGTSRAWDHRAHHIVDIALSDPEHIYMSLYAAFEPGNTLYRVDVNTGKAELVGHGEPNTKAWIMDGNGNIVARDDLADAPPVHQILAYTPDKNWREIAKLKTPTGQGQNIAGISVDGKSLVAYARADVIGLVLVSLADGKQRELYFHPVYDIDRVITDPWTGRVVGATYISHLPKSVYFDLALKQMQEKQEAQFPGMSVSLLSWDLARNKVVVSVEGPMSPTTFYLINQQANSIKRLGREHQQLQSSDLGQISVYDFKARDGLNIPAYLTLPPGKDAKNLPVVVLLHQGPMKREDMTFDSESQFLANRGYAVLRPNFRGSSGYGQKFEEAGFGQWGLKMQDDVTDGANKLVADGIADPKRICIAGEFYGGYAALAGAAFTPDLYACAVAWAPVADLQSLKKYWKDSAGAWENWYFPDAWTISTWTRYVGDRWNNSEKLDAVSPAKHADRVKIPVLLMHSEADTLRIDQSKEMDGALRDAGKRVTFISIPKKTDDTQPEEANIRWLTELEKFLKENIGN